MLTEQLTYLLYEPLWLLQASSKLFWEQAYWICDGFQICGDLVHHGVKEGADGRKLLHEGFLEPYKRL